MDVDQSIIYVGDFNRILTCDDYKPEVHISTHTHKHTHQATIVLVENQSLLTQKEKKNATKIEKK